MEDITTNRTHRRDSLIHADETPTTSATRSSRSSLCRTWREGQDDEQDPEHVLVAWFDDRRRSFHQEMYTMSTSIRTATSTLATTTNPACQCAEHEDPRGSIWSLKNDGSRKQIGSRRYRCFLKVYGTNLDWRQSSRNCRSSHLRAMNLLIQRS